MLPPISTAVTSMLKHTIRRAGRLGRHVLLRRGDAHPERSGERPGTRGTAHARTRRAMAKARTPVGLDVHAAKIVAAGLDADRGELKAFAMTGDVLAAAGFCAGLPRPVRVAYEAGSTGYTLARELASRRVD
jgi:hypothetical protein